MQKHTLKTIFFIAMTVLVNSNLYSQQIIIKEAGIRFNLNDTLWKRNTSQNDNTNNATVYRYKRIPIETSDGRQVIPTITVVVEIVQDSLDVNVFSAMKKAKIPFDVEDMFTAEKGLLQYQNAIGYRGGYTDKTGIRHTIMIIYLINKNKGVQILMDITRELFDEYKGEFDDVIRSIGTL